MTEYSNEYLNDSDPALIERFEQMLETRRPCFFDVEDVETLADYYLEKGNHFKARQAIQHGLDMHPDSSALMLKQAHALMMIKEPQKALKILTFLEAAEPMNTEMLLFKAVVHRDLADHEGTKQCLRKALEASPENKEEIFLDLAFEQELAQDYFGAIDSLTQSLEINPNHEEALFELAFCFDMANNIEEGVDYFQEYIDRFPYSFIGWYNLALCFEKLGLHEKALEAIEYALAIKEDFVNAYILKGNICAEHLDDLEAIDAYQASLIYDFENPMVHVAIGEIYERLAEMSLAEASYQQALDIDPKYMDALLGMGAVREYQGDCKACFAFYREAIDTDETQVENWHIYAEALMRAMYFEECEQAYRHMVKTFEDDEESWTGLAELLDTTGRSSEACQLMHDAIAQFLQTEEVMWYLCKYLIKTGKMAQAIIILAQIIESDPEGVSFFKGIYPDYILLPNVVGLLNQKAQAPEADEF